MRMAVVAVCMAWSAACAAADKVRVGVFVDRGADCPGMMRWVQIACSSPELEPTYIDGHAIRNENVLDRLDMVIMPGGYYDREFRAMGKDGVAKLKDFILRGGGYMGTCAGAWLLMQGNSKDSPQLGIIPYKSQPGPYRWGSIVSMRFNERAKELMGLKAVKRRVRYHGGPLMIPGTPVTNANFEVLGTFVGDLNPGTEKATKSMSGTGCVVAGTYGKGRVLVFANHPEYFPSTYDIVRGGFKYVAQRDVTWDFGQRKPGQLAVGLFTDWAIGVRSAQACRDLFKSGVADVTLLTTDLMAEGAHRHLDVLVVPNMHLEPNALRRTFYGARNMKLFEEFTARGGIIVSWDEAAKVYPGDRRNFVATDSRKLVDTLRKIAAAPAPGPAPAPKKVRAAVYADNGVSCAEYWNVSRLMACSPNYEVKFVSAADIRAGALDQADLFLLGGGWSPAQYNCLGEQGRTAVTNFVARGGAYYGICAGAFNALQTSNPKTPRLGLLPFKHQTGAPYRGWANIRCKFTDEAPEALGFAAGSEKWVLYWGGPVILPGDPMPNATGKVFLRYSGHNISTFDGDTSLPMGPNAAIVGGTFGKGRVVASGPHPECSESTQDLVRAILRHLTGVPADPVYPNRKRGAISVAFCMGGAVRDGMTFGMSLVRDDRFDVLPITNYETGHGQLDHTDVLFFPWPVRDGYMRLVYEFLDKGGHVVEVDPEGKGTEKHANVIRVKTYDEAREAMLKLK